MNVDNVMIALGWLAPFLFLMAVALGALAQLEMDRRASGVEDMETCRGQSLARCLPEFLFEMGCYIVEVEYIPRHPKTKPTRP